MIESLNPSIPNLLNEDGTASMATMLLLSHHAFRRDMARFIQAVAQIKEGDMSHAEALRQEWETSYRAALHGHHMMEDGTIFPDIKNKHPDLAAPLEKLTAQHHQIDPVLEKGDVAFVDLAHPEKAAAVLTELKALLDEHLTFEEAEITPFLREGKDFPVPPDEKMAALYAGGFAWSMQGIAPKVLGEVQKMLPDTVVVKLPEAQKEFETRSKRVWGEYTVGVATTPIPQDY